MRKWIPLSMMFLAIFILKTPDTNADTITFQNQDSLSGKVISINKHTLKFESDQLGSLTIPIKKLKSLETVQPKTMVLQVDQPATSGRLLFENNQQYLFDGKTKRPVNLGEIVTLGKPVIIDDTQKIKQVKPVPVTTTKPKEKTESKEESKNKFIWDRSFELLLAGRSGNTERASIGTHLKLNARNPLWKNSAYFRSLYANKNSDGDRSVTDEEYRFGVRVQKAETKNYSAFTSFDFENDRVQRINYRAVINSGLAYAWVKSEKVNYETSVGLGIQTESVDKNKNIEKIDPVSGQPKTKTITIDESNSTPIAQAVSELRLKINKRVDLTQKTKWIPDLNNEKNFRINADTSLVVYMDDKRKTFIKSGVTFDYNNQPPDDVEPLDTYYATTFGYQF